MDLSLNGRRALVCGASKGIGKAIAIELASLGAQVTVLARSAETLTSVCEGLPRPSEQRHTSIVADVEVPDELIHSVEDHVNSYGAFHICVNNTGGPAGGLLVESSVESIVQAFENHVVMAHRLMQVLVPGMKVENWGRFINIISTSVKQPLEGLGVSNTVRGAMASWAKTLATEVAPWGITVNNVLPGATETERLAGIIDRTVERTGRTDAEVRTRMVGEIPVGRFGRPEEIAAAAAFLATPAAAYITGTSILVDGGRTRTLS
ncbi:MAG TPA: short-chain dehydrogenase [Bacteroidetes bacterium]|nr:short-chain dehydrogenase [Bacteroidota bacterium]HRK03768.1 SDR family oxidoreductase [Chlorobiota bacterium]